MNSFENIKSYVVYAGRRPGVYYTWIDCFAQVYRFAGSACDVFNTASEALIAWDSFDKSTINGRRGIIRESNTKEDACSRLTTMIGSEFVTCDTSVRYMAQWNMQLCLHQACHRLRIGDPTYTRVEEKVFDGQSIIDTEQVYLHSGLGYLLFQWEDMQRMITRHVKMWLCCCFSDFKQLLVGLKVGMDRDFVVLHFRGLV
ncbi:Ribosomal protein L9/RNase H1, N-terminal [Sesbania bispinosa]|nr:Ribosomal protein L9/RNase H1, N-terminal [Sesbania bispinosa]